MSPKVSLIVFRIRIIYEGEQWFISQVASLLILEARPVSFLYHLLLGNHQEICPMVFLKGCNQGSCPGQEKDKRLESHGLFDLSCTDSDIKTSSVCAGAPLRVEMFRCLEPLLQCQALHGMSGT